MIRAFRKIIDWLNEPVDSKVATTWLFLGVCFAPLCAVITIWILNWIYL